MKTISKWAFRGARYIKCPRVGLSGHLFYISSAAATSGRQVTAPAVQLCYLSGADALLLQANLMVQQLD